MSGKLARHFAAIAIVGVALTGAAPAATLGAHGVTRFSHAYGHGIGSAQFGATSHFGQLGARLGGAYGVATEVSFMGAGTAAASAARSIPDGATGSDGTSAAFQAMRISSIKNELFKET